MGSQDVDAMRMRKKRVRAGKRGGARAIIWSLTER
jgi:hypothetical protein